MKKGLIYGIVVICLVLSGAFASRSYNRRMDDDDAMKNQEIVVEESSMEYPKMPLNTYPFDIEEDRKVFDVSKPDLYLKDSLYAATINDWYMNFADYKDKVIWMDGLYFKLGKSTFVGRIGPSCPFCNGGYVSFEFHTDLPLDGFVSEKTWVRVKGVLKEGKLYPGDKKAPYPLYYLEGIDVEKIDAPDVEEVFD